MSAAMSADSERPDEFYLARAITLAERGLYTTDPNPRVGCVLVREGRIVGEGWHERAGDAHAEVAALRAAAAAGAAVAGATAYVTLEPCSHTGRTPPCADALIGAGIRRVVCASVDPNPKVAGAGIARLRAGGIEVTVGPCASEARALNPGFFSRFERGRPLIRLKLAMSLDGRTAPAGGGRLWITGEAAREDVQRWRARSSAVLTGAGTVRVDDPRLDVRLAYGPYVRQPLRVLLDPRRSCAPSSRIFAGGPALVIAAAGGASSAAPLPGGVEVECLPAPGGALDLKAVVERLCARELNEVLVECGPRLAASFLSSNLVDELIVYVAPVLLGADAAPLAALPALESGALPAFEFRGEQRVGRDIRLVLAPKEH